MSKSMRCVWELVYAHKWVQSSIFGEFNVMRSLINMNDQESMQIQRKIQVFCLVNSGSLIRQPKQGYVALLESNTT